MLFPRDGSPAILKNILYANRSWSCLVLPNSSFGLGCPVIFRAKCIVEYHYFFLANCLKLLILLGWKVGVSLSIHILVVEDAVVLVSQHGKHWIRPVPPRLLVFCLKFGQAMGLHRSSWSAWMPDMYAAGRTPLCIQVHNWVVRYVAKSVHNSNLIPNI